MNPLLLTRPIDFFQNRRNWSPEKIKAIDSANFHASYGKWSQVKEAALELNWYFTRDEYRENAKTALLDLALNNPKTLRELADELCRLKRASRDKCPRGGYLISAYAACDSFPPAFGEVKQMFIARFGKKNGTAVAMNTIDRTEISPQEKH